MAATSAAVALSWFSVHSVLTGTVYDPPRALPITNGQPSAAGGLWDPPSSSSSSTRRPSARATSHPAKSPSPSRERRGAAESARRSEAAPSPEYTADVRSYTVQGGRVALDLGPDWAELVSATPYKGWSVKVWDEQQWIRVDFSQGNDTSSVFCTWNGHPPTVQKVER
jgi:hypothetical protein